MPLLVACRGHKEVVAAAVVEDAQPAMNVASPDPELPRDVSTCLPNSDVRADTWRRIGRIPGGGTFADTHIAQVAWPIVVVAFGAPVPLGSFVYKVGSKEAPCTQYAGTIAPGTPTALATSFHGFPDVEVEDPTHCVHSLWVFDGAIYREKRRSRVCD